MGFIVLVPQDYICLHTLQATAAGEGGGKGEGGHCPNSLNLGADLSNQKVAVLSNAQKPTQRVNKSE